MNSDNELLSIGIRLKSASDEFDLNEIGDSSNANPDDCTTLTLRDDEDIWDVTLYYNDI